MSSTYTNALAGQTSAYLLQHAHNPVEWYPWGPEALQKARDENKLLIISIGYAACHWCHVMERESFEDKEVAAYMNEHFVCIKVDREERPDIDDIYMSACQLSGSGSCGWPLNAIAQPDARPIWAGTYFPKRSWLNVLGQFVQMRSSEPEKLEAYARQITQELQASEALVASDPGSAIEREALEAIWTKLEAMFDPRFGGFGGAPKFPLPSGLALALRPAGLKASPGLKTHVERSLMAMAWGGIYDAVGGGFARYSVDSAWKVPHFEKMLYDNGQLLSLYSKAYRLFRRPLYADVIRQSIAFLEREMLDAEGGFYSSLDADSEGVEGKFYTWPYHELREKLSPDALSLLKQHFDVSEAGNWEEQNILYRRECIGRLAALAQDPAIPSPLDEDFVDPISLSQAWLELRDQLLDIRSSRHRPGLDDKVLLSWNALCISGLTEAYLALGEDKYLKMAQQSGQFIVRTFSAEGASMLRSHAKGKTHIQALLEDYAYWMQACTDLYQADFDRFWLDRALETYEYVVREFAHPSSALLFSTQADQTDLVARRVDNIDSVQPSANGVFAKAAYTLGRILDRSDLIRQAEAMLLDMMPLLRKTRQPIYHASWFELLDLLSAPGVEYAILGSEAKTRRLELARRYEPAAIYVGSIEASSLPLLENRWAEGKTRIFRCENKVCSLPAETVEELWQD